MDIEIPVTEARAQLSELVNRVGYGKERIILTRHGKPLVALVPAEALTDTGDEGTPAIVLGRSYRSDAHQSSYGIAARSDSNPQA